jgi:hypothetical protein
VRAAKTTVFTDVCGNHEWTPINANVLRFLFAFIRVH